MRLITEEVEWFQPSKDTWYLRGRADHVASIKFWSYHGWRVWVYSTVRKSVRGYSYNDGTILGHFDTEEDAKRACEEGLIAVGLLDPIVWLTT